MTMILSLTCVVSAKSADFEEKMYKGEWVTMAEEKGPKIYLPTDLTANQKPVFDSTGKENKNMKYYESPDFSAFSSIFKLDGKDGAKELKDYVLTDKDTNDILVEETTIEQVSDSKVKVWMYGSQKKDTSFDFYYIVESGDQQYGIELNLRYGAFGCQDREELVELAKNVGASIQ